MNHRLLAIAVIILMPVLGLAQDARSWTPPRTTFGQPDLQGYWTNVSFTPLERPAEFAGKAFFAEAEAVEFFTKAKDRDFGSDPGVHYDPTIYGMDKWQNGVKLNLRTSLIIDPPDGRIPPPTPEGQKRAAAFAAPRKADGPEDRSLFERCIRGTQGPPMLPGNFDNEFQILQTPDMVMILAQSMNDVRIIPLDGRPHLPENIRLLLGDSRGRWEGETLVVDTTNFSAQTNFRGATAGMHLVERFTRVGPDAIRYQFTVEDPAMWTRPWTVEVPVTRVQGPIYEFACHEGNYALEDILSGARAIEAAAGKEKK